MYIRFVLQPEWNPVDSCCWSACTGLRIKRRCLDSTVKRPQGHRVLRLLRERREKVRLWQRGQNRHNMDFQIGRYFEVLAQRVCSVHAVQPDIAPASELFAFGHSPVVERAESRSKVQIRGQGQCLRVDRRRSVHGSRLGHQLRVGQKQKRNRASEDRLLRRVTGVEFGLESREGRVDGRSVHRRVERKPDVLLHKWQANREGEEVELRPVENSVLPQRAVHRCLRE